MKLQKSLVLASTLALATSALGASKFQAYGGISMMPIEVTGYQNAVLNDEHNYPNAIGATFVEFEKGNVSETGTGITVGMQYMIAKNHGPVIDYTSVSSGDVTGSVIGLGYKYSKSISDKFSIGIIPKFGVASITTDLGALVAYGTMPVITDGQTYYEGDLIEAEASGTVMSVEVEANYGITKKILGFFKIGFQTSSFDKPTTNIGGSELTDDKALDSGSLNGNTVSYDASSNIDPFSNVEANMDGMILSFGVNYKF